MTSWETRATARRRSGPGCGAGASAHHPGTGRPDPQPGPSRQPRRTPPTVDREIYKHRNVVERCFSRLKQWRGIATRYDKTAESYQAAITLAALLMWA
ncbi:transposase [Streptomyces albus]|nr:transposase [Streptomyces albus]